MANTTKLQQFTKINESDILSISLGIASAEDVKAWSHGEVTSPETINYKTYKPERYGLFDEVIFGPQTDYKCPICGTKYKRFNEGQICEKTDECKIYQPEILPAIARRTRMAHITLASPVVHYWFFKIDNSIIAKLLGLRTNKSTKVHSKTAIEDLIYFKSHIVLEDGGLKSLPKNEIIEINRAAIIYRNALLEIRDKYEVTSKAYKDITQVIDDLEATATSKIGKDYGIDFYELNEIVEEYSDAKIGTGAKAIEYLLSNIDVKSEIRRVKAQILRLTKDMASNKLEQKSTEVSKRYRRLEVLNAFANSSQDPKSLLIYNLPIIPADLRPLIQIDGGRHSTADINELYRRIIIRNNRLKKWIELDAPVLIIQNEQRMLQEAVDALIDNERRKPSPVLSKDGRPLKSIASSLIKGKKGLFIGNLLGKRVDYSGRSVIVVGPELKMHQAGIPRQMAAKLFEPWIIKGLLKAKQTVSIKSAKKLIEEQDNLIWPFVEEAIKGKIVLLNRAPTLHRLSIQAFEPVLIRGKAIRLHPLVTAAFNADFDGDQMAVHVPISPEAIREAREIMLANRNILGPKDGEPIINPSQDMILGLYYLTKEQAKAKGEGHYYASYAEMSKAYENGFVHLHARVAIPAAAIGKQYYETSKHYVVSTVGKFILNNAFPNNFPFVFDMSEESSKPTYAKYLAAPGADLKAFTSALPVNKPFTKKNIAKIVRRLFDQYTIVATKEDIAKVLSTVHSGNAANTVMSYAELKDFGGKALPKLHCQILAQITKDAFMRLNKRITLMNQGVERAFEIYERVELIEAVWFDYTNLIANALDNIKDLGFNFSMLSGTTISVDDIRRISVVDKKPMIKEAEKYTAELKDAMQSKGLLTDGERYRLVIARWTKVKSDVRKGIEQSLAREHDNPLSLMMESGARGSISNLEQLAGMRGLMANNDKERAAKARLNKEFRPVIENPVKSSFLDGLTSYEFYSSTHGARNGLTNTALGTGETGYLTHRLVDAAHHIIVKEEDCGATVGFKVRTIMDTKTGQIIIPLEDRIEGRFTSEAIYDKQERLVIGANELITPDIAKYIVNELKLESVFIRSLFNCLTLNGVCKKCYGKDLSSNRIVQIGEAVGIVAAQSIGEPGTQLTMRTFQKGGVAGSEGDYDRGGFQRLIQLVDATQRWEQKAEISRTRGKVVAIEQERPEEVVGDTKAREQFTVVRVQSANNPKEVQVYRFKSNRRIRVKDGQDVALGQKIVDGPIELDELMALAGIGAVQQYLLKEIQRLYRMQGISISDKYVEIIIRQMLSKILIKDPGDSQFFAGSYIDAQLYTLENKKLLGKGKMPAFGFPVVMGVKEVPLLAESFLAAASFQQTARVLVHAAIKNQIDRLEGLKENIILGHKIPSGTGSPFVERKSKYDVRDPLEYFKVVAPDQVK